MVRIQSKSGTALERGPPTKVEPPNETDFVPVLLVKRPFLIMGRGRKVPSRLKIIAFDEKICRALNLFNVGFARPYVC